MKEDLSDFEEKLIGAKYTSEDIRERLKDVDIKEYFAGFTLDEIVEAIVE